MDTNEKLRQQVEESLKQLRTLRDEVKLEIHLGTMEAKSRWEKEFEPRLSELETKAKHATDASRAAIHEAIDRLRQFRADLQVRH